LAGGLLYTYRTGSLIPQATYTDATLTTQNSTPIRLDAGGFAVSPSGSCGIFLDPNLTYTFTIRSAQGVQLWSVDGLTSGNFSILLGQANVWTGVQTFTGGIVVSGPATMQDVSVNGTAHINNLQCNSFQRAACIDSNNTQQWPGSDAGAWINSAYASLPSGGGDILVAAGIYSQSTAILFTNAGKPARLLCAPGNATTINYTGSGTAFTYDVAGQAGTHSWGGGLENCTLFGPGANSSTVGIKLGGINGAEGVVRRNVKVTRFGIAEQYSNNTYLTECLHCVYIDNGQDLNIPNTLSNSGESFSYVDSAFANSSGNNNTGCVSVAATVNNLSFIGGSFDNCQLLMAAGQVHVVNTHFENPNSGMTVDFIVQTGGRLALVNPDFEWDNSPAPTPSAAVYCSGGLLTAENETFFSASTTITSDYDLLGTCEFHETGMKLSSGFTNFYLTATTGAISTFGNTWASNQLIGAGDMLMSGSKLKLGPLNQNYYTLTPDNPATFRTVNIVDPGATFTMGATLNVSGAYQAKRGTAGCTTAATGGASCSFTVNWPHSFAGTNYSVACTPSGGATNFPSAPYVTTKNVGSVLVNYQANTSAAATWAFVDCVGVMD